MLRETPSQKFHNPQSPFIIALDGTSASGKGTLAKLIAARFSFTHCQSSIFYRRLALALHTHYPIELNNLRLEEDILLRSKLMKDLLSHQELISSSEFNSSNDIYTENITSITSFIASIPIVRQFLLAPQHEFLKNHPRVVMEGRDIGTVIAPDADIKIFITADIKVRAQRRFDQLTASGNCVNYADILANLKERDERDQGRMVAPLIKATEAIEIDTSNIEAKEVVEQLLKGIAKL